MDTETRWGREDRERRRSTRARLVALLLTCAALITLDHTGGGSSPLEPVRRAAGEVFGPVEQVTGTAVRPFTAVGDWFSSRSSMRAELDELRTENAELRSQQATAGLDRNRLAEFDGLTRAAEDLGQALVPARVVGYGPSQSFTRTVTIDAGSSAGLGPDMTVLNADGLVGRVLRVTRTTATVLLVADQGSVVGGRIGESMEIGFVRGSGSVAADGTLDFDLVDHTVAPAKDDAVLTWGSAGGGPYVAGVPVGRVTEVYSSLRDGSRRAVVQPFVDFSSLDLVGVVVPSGSVSDRAVIEADGTFR